LELARTAEYPEGSSQRGYEFVAPLTDDGHLDEAEWRTQRDGCTVHRFWAGENDEYGRLVHHGGERWAFWYDPLGDEGEEPIFRFALLRGGRVRLDHRARRGTADLSRDRSGSASVIRGGQRRRG
jgi:hypothetical protein